MKNFIPVLPILVSIGITFCHFACWDKQNVTLLKPEIPQYILSGFTLDMDVSTQIIPNTPITITAVQMLYDVTFDPVTAESDSNGYFQIDPVYPGDYTITANRYGYNVLSEKITISHDDKAYDLLLPTPLLNDYKYRLGNRNPGAYNPIFSWGNSLWFVGYYEIHEDWNTEKTKYWAIFNGNIINGSLDFGSAYRNTFPDAKCIVLANSLLYVYYNGKLNRYRTYVGLDGYLFLVDSVSVPDPFSSLCRTNSGFWSTFGSSIQFRGEDPLTIEYTKQVNSGNLGPLSKSGEYFYSYDKDRGLILKLDEQGNILDSYRPLDYDTQQWISVHDMDFSFFENLWVSDKTKGLFYSFSFFNNQIGI